MGSIARHQLLDISAELLTNNRGVYIVIELIKRFSMTLTRKENREASAAATAKEFLQSDHKSVANSKEVEEDDPTLDSEKREKDIVDWIGRPRKPPSSH